MTVYDLKPAFQGLLRPLCRRLARAGVSANQVTVLAMFGSAIVGGLFALGNGAPLAALLIPAWLFVRMALNAIDGMLAREHGMRTPLGGLLNELGDVASDALLYLPFAVVPGVAPPLVVVVVFLAALSEMAGVVGTQLGASRRYDGPMGKSDRAVVFSVLALCVAAGIDVTRWASPALVVVALLLALTILNRCRGALREIDDENARART